MTSFRVQLGCNSHRQARPNAQNGLGQPPDMLLNAACIPHLYGIDRPYSPHARLRIRRLGVRIASGAPKYGRYRFYLPYTGVLRVCECHRLSCLLQPYCNRSHQIVYLLCVVFLHRWQDMRIGIFSQADLGMAKTFLNDLQMGTFTMSYRSHFDV